MFERTKRLKKRIDDSAKKASMDLDKQKEIDAKRKHAAAVVRCTACGSENVNFLKNERKEFSVGKAVAGGILTGGIGTMAGFAGKKGFDVYRCNKCHREFKTK